MNQQALSEEAKQRELERLKREEYANSLKQEIE